MEINSTILELNEYFAVCSITVKSETRSVTLYATGLASESERYADLAQARALALARQVLEEGSGSIEVEAFLSEAQPDSVSKRMPEPAAPTPAPTTEPIPLVTPALESEIVPPVAPENEAQQVTPPAEVPATTIPEAPVEVDTSDEDKIVLDIPW